MFGASKLLAIVVAPALLAALLSRGSSSPDAHRMIWASIGNGNNGVSEFMPLTDCDQTSATHAAAACPSTASAASGLGQHTLLWHEDGNGPSTAVTQPITTQAQGSFLVAFNAGFVSNNNTPTDNKGNTFRALGAPVAYRGYEGRFNVKPYFVQAAHGGSGHQVSILKNGVPAGELTLPFIEITNFGANMPIVAVNYPDSGSMLTSASVTTTGPATLLAFWFGDQSGLHHSAVPNNGFQIIENFVDLPPNSAVQCVVAARQVTAAGTYNVSWANSPQQGAPLWLLAFPSGGDGVFGSGFD